MAVKKKAAKKAVVKKKAAVKKAAPKKAPKKTVKKAAVKTAKKTTAKKKVAPKKKVAIKKATPKKEAPKKKTTPKTAAPKKTVAKKVETKKNVVKKEASPKKKITPAKTSVKTLKKNIVPEVRIIEIETVEVLTPVNMEEKKEQPPKLEENSFLNLKISKEKHENPLTVHDDHEALPEVEHAPLMPIVRETPKIGRNEPCPCGSGKKYKKCHGKEE